LFRRAILLMDTKDCVVLMAEDDPDDRFLIGSAFEERCSRGCIRFVQDGEELMNYLRRRGEYGDEESFPRPDLLLLDLNMPKKDGRVSLAEIKGEPSLRDLPVVVVTTSSSPRDREYCMKYDIREYVRKPSTREELIGLIEIVRNVCLS
jgi:CheY-like chemotaxis protein